MNYKDSGRLSMRGRADRVLIGLLALSLITNVALGVGLARARTQPTVNNRGPVPAGPQIGQALPPLDVQRLGGGRETLRFSTDSRPTLIYVFTSHCGWCARNLNNIRTVFSAAKRSHRIIALSLDPQASNDIAASELAVPVFLRPSKEMRGPYALGPTPTTIVISPDGTVLKSWVGAYAGELQTEIEAYFGVELPGLRPVNRTDTRQKGTVDEYFDQ